MAGSFEIDVQGLDALNAKLKSVTEDLRKKGGRTALRKAAQLIRDDARKSARLFDDPATPSSIPENIIERWNGRLYKKRKDLGFRIGVKGGARPNNDPDNTAHWRYIEFGTSKVTARPFMRPALADNIGNATTVFIKEYNKAIDRAIKRAAKK